MADKSFGVKDINLIGASGTPTIDSPNNLNINAVNVAISTDITVGGKVSLGTGTSISSPGSNTLTLGTNSVERLRINSTGNCIINGTSQQDNLLVKGGSTQFAVHQDDTDGEVSLRAQDGSGSNNTKYMTFFTEGGSGPTERLRITTAGETLISNSGNRFLSLDRTNASSGTGEFNLNVESNSQASISYDDGAPLVIGTSSSPRTQAGFTERLRIDASGRVTIPSQPAALVYKTGTLQAFSSDGLVNYDATSYSQGGMTINGSRNRITVPVAGKYMINACTSGSITTVSAGDGWKLRILRDGSVYNHDRSYPVETTGSTSGQELAYTVSMVVDAAANDYFEIQIENIGSAAASMGYGYFGIYLLG